MEENVARLNGIVQKHPANDDLVEVDTSNKFDLIEMKFVF
jgi:hypothetical protein